ncbi:MAG: dUTP diphosphatase [Pedobacter sp.]
MKIKVKKLRSRAQLPRYMSRHAAGMDVFACPEEELVVEPGCRAVVPTGIAMAIPVGFEAQVRPRSGLALHRGVTLVNAPGTIDALCIEKPSGGNCMYGVRYVTIRDSIIKNI